jgi:hypothetical protein
MSGLKEHEQCLREKVFFTKTRWPQYDLLLSDLKELNDMLPNGSYVVSYERNLLYGGFSPFAPFFDAHNFHSIDHTPEDRGAYNKVEDDRFIKSNNYYCDAIAQLIIVPNVLHHIKHQDSFFKILRSNSKYVYIFEPLVREIHQAPHDYIRYTPDGIRGKLDGLKVVWERETGGPFTALMYVADQAMQYMPEEEIDAQLIIDNPYTMKEAIEMDEKYNKNLVRMHTRFPTAFSILVEC